MIRCLANGSIGRMHIEKWSLIHNGDTYLFQMVDRYLLSSHTRYLGNFHESNLIALADPIVAYSNSPAYFNISLASGEYSVGETVYISISVSDADGHEAISQGNYGVTWYRHDNQVLNLGDANSYEIINISDSLSYTISTMISFTIFPLK